jgi:hypothetical protein
VETVKKDCNTIVEVEIKKFKEALENYPIKNNLFDLNYLYGEGKVVEKIAQILSEKIL